MHDVDLVLVPRRQLEGHGAAVGFGAGRRQRHDLDRAPQRVAGPDRRGPTQLVQADADDVGLRHIAHVVEQPEADR